MDSPKTLKIDVRSHGKTLKIDVRSHGKLEKNPKDLKS
jgi:hypothetical protein